MSVYMCGHGTHVENREQLVEIDSLSNRLGSKGLYLSYTHFSPPHPLISPHPVGYPLCHTCVLMCRKSEVPK